MALDVKCGTPHDFGNLAAKIRDASGRSDVRCRRKQADNLKTADQLAVGAMTFDNDVIHCGSAVHPRAGTGLRDNERLGLPERRERARRQRKPATLRGKFAALTPP